MSKSLSILINNDTNEIVAYHVLCKSIFERAQSRLKFRLLIGEVLAEYSVASLELNQSNGLRTKN